MKEKGELGYGLALCDTMGLGLINPHSVERPRGKQGMRVGRNRRLVHFR
jgi:hypothetical protein